MVVYYDYFLTLSDKVALTWRWRRDFSPFSCIFLIDRYVPLIGDFPILLSGVIGQSCFMVRILYLHASKPGGPPSRVVVWHLKVPFFRSPM